MGSRTTFKLGSHFANDENNPQNAKNWVFVAFSNQVPILKNWVPDILKIGYPICSKYGTQFFERFGHLICFSKIGYPICELWLRYPKHDFRNGYPILSKSGTYFWEIQFRGFDFHGIATQLLVVTLRCIFFTLYFSLLIENMRWMCGEYFMGQSLEY